MWNKRKLEEKWRARGTLHRSLGGRGATFCLLCVCLLLHSGTLCVGEPVDFCTNSCDYREDRSCDDGGPESDYQGCPLGTDCSDCGPRKIDLDQEKPKFHTFSDSDGLYKLQQKYGGSVAAMLRWNGLWDVTSINVGQKLRFVQVRFDLDRGRRTWLKARNKPYQLIRPNKAQDTTYAHTHNDNTQF